MGNICDPENLAGWEGVQEERVTATAQAQRVGAQGGATSEEASGVGGHQNH